MRRCPDSIDSRVHRIFDRLRRRWPGQGRWNDSFDRLVTGGMELQAPLAGLGGLLGRLQACRRRGQRAAAGQLLGRLGAELDVLALRLSSGRALLGQVRYSGPPSLWRLWGEVVESVEAYGLRLSADSQTLIATTEPITLSDEEFSEELGPMEIRIPIESFGGPGRSFTIVAVEPNECDGYIHPHVASDGRLCEGEATVPLNHAWRAGMLAEVLHILDATLRTYNPHSAYERLDRWGGGAGRPSCYDCGYSMPEDEGYGCEICQETFCSACSHYSEALAMSLCDRCGVRVQTAAGPDYVDHDSARQCDGCEDLWFNEDLQEGLCPACWAESFLCTHCGQRRCAHEQSATEGLCLSCQAAPVIAEGPAVPAAPAVPISAE